MTLEALGATQKLILRRIFHDERVTRQALAASTGLSILTIVKVVKSLITSGLVIESEKQEVRRGRKPLALRINPDYAYMIGIDIGSYCVKVGLVKFNGELHDLKLFYTADLTRFPVEVVSLEQIIATAEELLNKHGRERVIGIGVGVSGIVNHACGKVIFCPNMVGYTDLPISDILQERLGLPVQVDTSARCMALAERYFGAGKGKDDLVLVSVGHSIAAGIIVGGAIFRGTNGYAGEIGHVKHTGNRDSVCSCGSYGCIENYATIPVIRTQMIERLDGYSGYSRIGSLYRKNNDLTIAEIAEAFAEGDKVAMEVVYNVVHELGSVVSDFVNLFNPSLMVFGGGFMDLFPDALSELTVDVRRKCLTPSAMNLELKKAQLDFSGSVIGSALQILECYIN